MMCFTFASHIAYSLALNDDLVTACKLSKSCRRTLYRQTQIFAIGATSDLHGTYGQVYGLR
jgi:hypothetical protein